MKHEFVITLFAVALLGVGNVISYVCNPDRGVPFFQDRSGKCLECFCSSIGTAVVCRANSCILKNGTNVVNEWGIEDYRIVKLCSPDQPLYVACNRCRCDRNRQPGHCTIKQCEKSDVERMIREDYGYPLVTN